ncbi:MAG TPA: hypothetical protein PK867_28180 [Pirellulales bacterium]|nr:hypothetical protein [Pirellulales bacterium]
MADKAVIAIGIYLKAGIPDPASLGEAMAACSDMLARLARTDASPAEKTQLSPSEAAVVERGRRALENAASGKAEVSREDLTALQQLLVQRSMPDWKSRMNEFRERRLKRGLRRHV